MCPHARARPAAFAVGERHGAETAKALFSIRKISNVDHQASRLSLSHGINDLSQLSVSQASFTFVQLLREA